MKYTKMARTGFWGLVIGGAVGFTMGLLLAPERGQRMRRRVIYQLEHLAEEVGTLVDHVMGPAIEEGEARRRGHAVVADAEAEAQNISQEIDTALRQARQRRRSSAS